MFSKHRISLLFTFLQINVCIYGNYNFNMEYCGDMKRSCIENKNSLVLLTCALNFAHNNSILTSCQHEIWKQQAYMLDNDFLKSKLEEPCHRESMILDCLKLTKFNVDCVLEKKIGVKTTECKGTILNIEKVLFNDWQVVNSFVKKCFDNIENYKCGRIPIGMRNLSQILTLQCLKTKEKNLHPECISKMNALMNIKYDTFSLDSLIIAACMADIKNFCSDEIAEPLSIHKCLERHKHENGMSKRCQKQLFLEDRNMVDNYQTSKGLAKSCKEDIKKHHCRKSSDDKDIRLSKMLLCLENVLRNDSTKLAPECIVEMHDHRKMLMGDYRLSPEVMSDCSKDIELLCSGLEHEKIIHCLIEHTKPRRRGKKTSRACRKSLALLFEEVDPGEDWRVDPILRKACKPVVDRVCRELSGGNGQVMSCLMDNIGTDLMSDDCERALMNIHYFISRDFRLDPQLYGACKYDAVTQCKARLQWGDNSVDFPDRDQLVLPCLYNFVYKQELAGILKPACEYQIKRVMRERAISVDLLPELESFCIEDLQNLCFANSGRGEEILCLQKRINELTQKCKGAVTNFTIIQSNHIELNPVVFTNCRMPIKKLCSSELKSKAGEDNVMDCLIDYKNKPEIKSNEKCRAAIEHEQLIALANFKFTRKFQNACKSYVNRFCPRAKNSSQVVACLSEIIRDDIINENKHVIFKDCRHQLRRLLLEQRESIDLDPELLAACREDLYLHCANVPHSESKALECLQTTKDKLSFGCRRALFNVRRQEFTDNAVDYNLVNVCNNMIDLYCHNTDASKVLDCLEAHHHKVDFENSCRNVVVNRMRERNNDFRFNYNLQTACRKDIKIHCNFINDKDQTNIDSKGDVLHCLKKKFRKLSLNCENEVTKIEKEQALNYHLDPLLERLCKAEIQTICNIPNDSITNADGQVEECLKKALVAHKIVSAECAREVALIIENTEIDIDADPLLERACALDLLRYCKDLEHGAGRRLKCLKIILNDSTRKLEAECQKELETRLEMYRMVEAVKFVENFGDVFYEISSSPSRKYFLLIIISFIGLIFIFGLYCGRITKKAMYVKRK